VGEKLPWSEDTRQATAGARSVDDTDAELRDEIANVGGRIEHYELIRPLGRGGMGTVHLARDTKLGRLVAIKLMRSRTLVGAERFRVEARATARCVHENIVVIHETGEQKGYLYMVLEFLAGVTLKQWLDERARASRVESDTDFGGAPLSPQRAIEIITPVVRALECAHRHGIVHRDLKPANVMLCDSGAIKVLDFGVAKLLDVVESVDTDAAIAGPLPAELTFVGRRVGSEPYMSPEQWGADVVDHRSDIWAVGMILFEMLDGGHPLRGTPLRVIGDLGVPMPQLADRRPGLGKLASIVDRCLLKRKDDRIGSAHELLAQLAALAPRGGVRGAGGEDARPYAGLASFHEDDADRFFGRDRDVAAAVARLREQPLLAVVAPSGAGKSSFVRAGLIPALKRSGDAWYTLVMRPGRQPLHALANALIEPTSRITVDRTDSGDADPEQVVQRLRELPGYLGMRLRGRAHRRLSRIMVFVDQFEELYTLGADLAERRAFLACLEGVADDPGSPLRVVIALRSDFLDRCSEAPAFVRLLTGGLVLLPPVDPDGMREILTRPLENVGYRFESEAMVDDMLDALERTPAALPLLQFTASKLWDTRDRKRQLLTEASYRSIGGIAGTLAAHADLVVAGMSARDQVIARRVFERLVTPERTRAIASLADLRGDAGDADEVERVVDLLVQARLLVIESDVEGADATYELVHESLIERWPTLARWLSEHQEDAAFLSRLRGAAKEWRASGRPSGLLWRDEAMLEAKRFRRRSRAPLATVELEFLAAVFDLADRTARRRRAAWIALFAAALASSAVMATLAWRERAASERARLQAAETRRAAELAHAEAAHARDAARIAAAREALDDPTLALALLREVEQPDRWAIWASLAATVMRAPIAQAEVSGHEGGVWTAELSPDGRRVATASDDNTARIWSSDGRGAPIVLAHDGAVWVAAWSPDGRKLLTASWDGTARIWNADGSGTPIVMRHPDRVSWAEWSPDGRQVVTSSWDRIARVWNADGSGTPIELRGHASRVYRASFSPDGRRVATAAEDGTARIWNADGSGTPIVLVGHRQLIRAIAFSPDGTRLATAADDGLARIWPVDGGAPVILRGHAARRWIWDITFSADGRQVLTACSDGTARIWNADGRGAPVVIVTGGEALRARFSPDERYIVTASSDGMTRLWNRDGSPTGIVYAGKVDAVRWVSFSRDGRIVTTSDRGARVWTLRQPQAPLVISGPTGEGPTVALSPDGTRVVTGWPDGTVRVSAIDGMAPTRAFTGHTGAVTALDVSADSTRAVSASIDHTARIWRLDGGAPTIVLRGHRAALRSVAFSRDGERVATAANDHTMRVWHADGTGPVVVGQHPTENVLAVELSPDGTHVTTRAWNDDAVRVWRTDVEAPPVVLEHATDVYRATWSPDSRKVAVALSDVTARIWNADGSGTPIVLEGHTEDVRDVVFTRDGRRLITASTDGTARIWNADGSGAPVVLAAPGPGGVTSAEPSPDGARVVTVAGANARVWRSDGAGVPLVLAGHTAELYGASFTSDGTRVVTWARDATVRVWPDVEHVPTLAELRAQLWARTPYCMPADLRERLLGVAPDRAALDVLVCRRRVDLGR